MVEAVAVAFSMAWPRVAVQDAQDGEQARGVLAAFRGELFRCFGKYRDTLAEVCDAVLCKQDRVHMAAELSVEPECRRGHGAVYPGRTARRGRVLGGDEIGLADQSTCAGCLEMTLAFGQVPPLHLFMSEGRWPGRPGRNRPAITAELVLKGQR